MSNAKYTEKGIEAIAFLKAGEIFPREYIKTQLTQAVVAYARVSDEQNEVFLGFKSNTDTNQWEEYAYITVNAVTGDSQFLDFKLPNGRRMNNPQKKIIYT